jgi:hypothetical protein
MATRLLSKPAALLRWTNAARRTADKLVRVIARLLLPSARDAAQVFDIAQWMAAWEALVSAGETMIPITALEPHPFCNFEPKRQPPPGCAPAEPLCFAPMLFAAVEVWLAGVGGGPALHLVSKRLS